jgi:high-affinity Fe2+/Pb2+ permease
MKIALRLVSWSGLGLTLVPAWLFHCGTISDGQLKQLLLAGMVLWFAAAIPAQNRSGR